ncbi:MAG: hypothetical protein GQ569_09580 [Methylococcaceae bacterium]|nr:hypothetical protein [Methylococcaceae bacterium]
MINAEQIYHKAQLLDSTRLQELTDFLDFLLTKKPVQNKANDIFPETQLESIDTPSVYHGKPLTIEEMNDAIEWEASQKL